jgi:hypothetical protein
MAVLGLTVLTLALMVWSACSRRAAWWCRGERDISVAVAFMTVAILVLIPPLSGIIGNAAHRLSGQWNLQAFVAHVLCIGADAAIVHHIAWRIHPRRELGRIFRTHVELPSTLGVGLMFAFFELGNGSRVRARCFYLVPMDIWLSLYWLVFCAVLAYIILYAARLMMELRADGRSRTTGTIYLAGICCGIAALGVRAAGAVVTELNTEAGFLVAGFFGCSAVAAFGWGAAYSWRQKQRWFTHPEMEEA